MFRYVSNIHLSCVFTRIHIEEENWMETTYTYTSQEVWKEYSCMFRLSCLQLVLCNHYMPSLHTFTNLEWNRVFTCHQRVGESLWIKIKGFHLKHIFTMALQCSNFFRYSLTAYQHGYARPSPTWPNIPLSARPTMPCLHVRITFQAAHLLSCASLLAPWLWVAYLISSSSICLFITRK